MPSMGCRSEAWGVIPETMISRKNTAAKRADPRTGSGPLIQSFSSNAAITLLGSFVLHLHMPLTALSWHYFSMRTIFLKTIKSLQNGLHPILG